MLYMYIIFFFFAKDLIILSPFYRAAHDISLEEFDDEDLSEITDDCGIGLNYDSDPYEKVNHILFTLLYYSLIFLIM